MVQELAQRHEEEILIESMKEVGPTIFASMIVIAVAFMPVFTLEAQEGRLFKPLAFTKISRSFSRPCWPLLLSRRWS